MSEVDNNSRISCKAIIPVRFLFSAFAAAQIRKELRFKIGAKPQVSITKRLRIRYCPPAEDD